MATSTASSGAEQAITEGRRIYLGGLEYALSADEVTAFIQQETSLEVQNLHFSLDAVYGRNPGYCFVDFFTSQEADDARATLQGRELKGRSLRTGPCEPKRSDGRARHVQGGREKDRPWEKPGGWTHFSGEGQCGGFARESQDWRSPREPQGEAQGVSRNGDSGRARGYQDRRDQDARGGFSRGFQDWRTKPQEGSRQGESTNTGSWKRPAWESQEVTQKTLYVSGLPHADTDVVSETEIREIFKGFDVESVSKRKNPTQSFRENPGNHYFCFVVFTTNEEASKAMIATNGIEIQGSPIRVSIARPKTKPREES
ncbi:hypothetical protein K461DRAFT_291689 [Myriangium duriaei CBS 260.36]|uniref:RRM domain-containing protein n=1 Tax=Myriangium duriaei CBS 260.36 TaxID=1168546 RepID=A0A9P4J993_9PEZI|nr:hypothetical protein K461DRAFT_291689 [Myriangium duriaei CBS 260.36]